MTEQPERDPIDNAAETPERWRQAEELLEELLAAHDARDLSAHLEAIGKIRRFLAER